MSVSLSGLVGNGVKSGNCGQWSVLALCTQIVIELSTVHLQPHDAKPIATVLSYDQRVTVVMRYFRKH